MRNYEFKDPKEIELITRVTEVFLRLGIKSVTMDDISKELHVSKKTLYKYVKNRSELVNKVMQLSILGDENAINTIKSQYENAIDEQFQLLVFFKERVSQIHPSVHFDLEKYFPEAWSRFLEYQNNFSFQAVLDNVQKGIKQGIYRSEINAEIISRLYVSRIEMIFNGQLFPVEKFKFSDVFQTLVIYHLRGICTEKGLNQMNQIDFSKI